MKKRKELIKCPACSTINNQVAKYCSRCGKAHSNKANAEQHQCSNGNLETEEQENQK